MTKYQKNALKHHCRFAFETVQPQFVYLTPCGYYSVVVTVNSGWE